MSRVSEIRLFKVLRVSVMVAKPERLAYFRARADVSFYDDSSFFAGPRERPPIVAFRPLFEERKHR